MLDASSIKCYYYKITQNKTLMDVFSTLSQRSKVLIVSCSVFLVTLSLGLLVFGTGAVSDENSLLEKAKNSTRADMLYIHPTDGGH